MKLVISILLAYAATGILYVWRDLSETNPVRHAFYVIDYRNSGNRTGLLIAGAGWLPGVIFSAFHKRQISRMGREIIAMSAFLVSFVLIVLIWTISN